MEQKTVVKKINQLEDHYCIDCPIKRRLRKESKTQAHHYCISKCTIGLEIKQWGNHLQ